MLNSIDPLWSSLNRKACQPEEKIIHDLWVEVATRKSRDVDTAHHLFKEFLTSVVFVSALNPSGYPSHSCYLDVSFPPFMFDYFCTLSIR